VAGGRPDLAALTAATMTNSRLNKPANQSHYRTTSIPKEEHVHDDVVSDNIEIITRFEHMFRAGDQSTIDELCDPAWSITIQRPTTGRR
jgi:hypothetical protein